MARQPFAMAFLLSSSLYVDAYGWLSFSGFGAIPMARPAPLWGSWGVHDSQPFEATSIVEANLLCCWLMRIVVKWLGLPVTPVARQPFANKLFSFFFSGVFDGVCIGEASWHMGSPL